MPVVGLFGPTASGKSDVAAAIAGLIPAEVVSADAMQVYDGLPILTNRSPHPERLVGIWPLDHEASVGEYAPLAHARDRRDARRRADAGRRRRDRPLLPGRARRARASAGAAGGNAREVVAASTTTTAARRRTPFCASSIRPRQSESIRTTAVASSARSSSPTPARRSSRATTGCSAAAGGIRRSSSGSTSRRSPRGAHRGADAADVRARGRGRGSAGARRPSCPRPRGR